MATAPVVIAGTYVDAIQPVVVSGMPLAGATPEQQQMPVVVVAGTYVRAQSRELARGIGSVQRGIARQLNGASSTRRLSGGTSSTPAPTERTEAASDASSSQLPPGSTLIDTTASQLPPPSGHQRAFAAEQADAAKVQCAKCKGARYVDGAMDVHTRPSNLEPAALAASPSGPRGADVLLPVRREGEQAGRRQAAM